MFNDRKLPPNKDLASYTNINWVEPTGNIQFEVARDVHGVMSRGEKMKIALVVVIVGLAFLVTAYGAEDADGLDNVEAEAELEENLDVTKEADADNNVAANDEQDVSEENEEDENEQNQNEQDEGDQVADESDQSSSAEEDADDFELDAENVEDGLEGSSDVAASEKASGENDPKPFWGRRRRSRRRRSRRRRSRRRRRRRRWISIRRRRRRIFFGRRRRFFTRRYWNRKFFPSCRRSSYRSGPNVLVRTRPLHACIYSNNLRYQASCWAPLIYLAIGESYKPSSVDFFFRHVRLVRYYRRMFYKTVLSNPNARNIVKGNSNYFFKSKSRICSPSSTVRFFNGVHPNNAPIYTLYREFKSGANSIRDFVYWAFYPYNRGKNVCIGLAAGGRCWGGCTMMGNHVGDWEHVTVRLKNNRPWKMYVGAHNFGGVYTWNGHTFVKGRARIKFSRDGHPVVFSSLGSHGHWIKPAVHTYKKIKNGEKLVDKTSAGTPWYTWKRMQLIRYWKNRRYSGRYTWLNFLGRWGDRKRGCAGLEKISGECRLNSGPTGPNDKAVMKSTTLSK